MKSRSLSVAIEAHCRALSACRRCALAPDVKPVTQPVKSPRVMLVGQAPGSVEAAGGKSFAGRAGRTLFQWLAASGIDEATLRAQVYIAAITRCYPGPSGSGRGDRVPNRAERERCADWLDTELEIIRPRLIIPVGRLAIERFFPPTPLASLVGRAHEIEIPLQGGHSIFVEAIPLPHPSGASSWIHERGHRDLVDQAIGLIADRFRALGVRVLPGNVSGGGKSRVA